MKLDAFWLIALALYGINWYTERKQPKIRARRALGRAKTVPISEIKDGEWARVTGTVGAVGPAMTSPVSERECIGFWSRVESKLEGKPILSIREDCGAFSITDDTGQVIVACPFQPVFDIEEEWSPMPDQHVAFLERIGALTDSALRDKNVRILEELLRPGDRVSVLGLAFLEPDPASPSEGFRSPPLVRHLRGSGGRPVILGGAYDPDQS